MLHALPVVSMSQNLLPFEPAQAALFGKLSWMRLKMHLLRNIQGGSFQRSDGVVFLTQYAAATVTRALGRVHSRTALIPHGVEPRFIRVPRLQRPISDCAEEDPFRILYVSVVMPYKHQVEVALAASRLRTNGVPIQVRFVGASCGSYGDRFRKLLDYLDPRRKYLIWRGAEPYSTISTFYNNAEAVVFASSCENLPNILVEAMASGLPIASSNRGPMPEVLADAGVYFDPEVPDSIAAAMRQLILDPALRRELAQAAWDRAKRYSWHRCARETLRFIADIAIRERQSATLVCQQP